MLEMLDPTMVELCVLNGTLTELRLQRLKNTLSPLIGATSFKIIYVSRDQAFQPSLLVPEDIQTLTVS